LKIVGLTGGIGSGKSTVAGFFKELGIAVYIADEEAKKLTNRSIFIRKKLIALLGTEAYNKEGLNRSFVAQKIFNNAELLQQVNAIIHPRVGQHFKRWVKKQHGSYCIKEAAILFENGGYRECDAMILVTAPKETRIERVMQRDGSTREEVLARMQHQWEDREKIPLADFVITNIHRSETQKTVKNIHKTLSKG
tara:strand:+ start:897 stop:1478 length:582 start_codon:yes stop_codon:yes gene_type:complete